ncbi:MAG: PH domain-containing protein [bacterium]
MLDVKNFPGKAASEETVLFLRQHWIQPVGIIILFIFLLSIPVAISLVIWFYLPELLTSNLAQALSLLVLSAYILMAVLFLFQTYLDYFLDTWHVTNERIISSVRVSLFRHTTSEVRFYRIQDITTEVNGFLPTLLDYGDIHIQTAGEENRFILENVEHPKKIVQTLLKLAETDRAKHAKELDLEEGLTSPKATPPIQKASA